MQDFGGFFLALLGAVGGSTITALVQIIVNRKKRDAEAIKVSAETVSIDVANKKALEEFWSELLEKREDMVEKIYHRLLILEERLVDQENKISGYQAERRKLENKKSELAREIDVLKKFIIESGLKVPKTRL